jgi:rare lipoprotein A
MKKTSLALFLLAFTTIGIRAQTTGLASYYDSKFNNRKTSSGEIYREDSLVCAHRTYPFGTLLKVKNLKNGKEVIARVIDRGPFKEGRIVDLSYAAAKELDMIYYGIVDVEISECGMKEIEVLLSDSLFFR